jgi:hypothetical protein
MIHNSIFLRWSWQFSLITGGKASSQHKTKFRSSMTRFCNLRTLAVSFEVVSLEHPAYFQGFITIAGDWHGPCIACGDGQMTPFIFRKGL